MAERPCLFLLPGLLCDATVFDAQVRSFSQRYDVRAPDFFGFDSLTEMAEMVLAHAPPRFSLAGFSMGGRVALEIMRLGRERVERLCLFDTGIHSAQPGEAEKRQVLVDLAYREGMQALAARWLPPMLHPSRRSDPAFIEPLTRMVMRATPAIHEGQIRALLNRPDASSQLARIDCPTLVLCGRQDEWSRPEAHRAIAKEISGSDLVILEGSGHFVSVEQPLAFSNALRAWLTKSV